MLQDVPFLISHDVHRVFGVHLNQSIPVTRDHYTAVPLLVIRASLVSAAGARAIFTVFVAVPPLEIVLINGTSADATRTWYFAISLFIQRQERPSLSPALMTRVPYHQRLPRKTNLIAPFHFSESAGMGNN